MDLKNGVAEQLMPSKDINRAGTDEYFDAGTAKVTSAFHKGASQDQGLDGTAGAHTDVQINHTSKGMSQPAISGTSQRPVPVGRGNQPQ
jgi:hypothetical protein